MLNLLPVEFIKLLEILLQSTFHNFLIQKVIVKYAIAKTKKELKVYSNVLHRSVMFLYIIHRTKIALLSSTMQNTIEN